MKTKCSILILLTILITKFSHSQNLSGKRWIFGSGRGVEAIFTDTARPYVHIKYTNGTPGFPFYHTKGHSNICDSATGKLLFTCNGMVVYDSTGAVMDNGDSLVEPKIYTHNAFPNSPYTQGSIILPKGSGGLFYVFVTTITDSAYTYNYTNPYGDFRFPFDRLEYSIVDMNLNGGLGKVIEKSKPILQSVAIHKVMMQACRHSNGIDWWLLKQGEYDTNRIYRFLVKADTIEGPWIQNFAEPKYPSYDLSGQYAFSRDGTKFASVQGKMNKLFLADFDRCTGELNNPKIIKLPIDSTTYLNLDNAGILDSANTGVCFSPNGQFVYITKRWNIYQYEYQLTDSILAWYTVRHGPDTVHLPFQNYGHLYCGLDNRIYIGNIGEQLPQMSVIDKPDIKGVGCQFCRKCLRLSDTVGLYNGVGFTSPPNMPDYTLWPSGQVCWPLHNEEFLMLNDELVVWPNPSNRKFYFKNKNGKRKDLFSLVGELLYTTKLDEIDIQRYAKGIYFIKCDGQTKKVVIE